MGARRLPGRPSSPPARRWPAAQLGGLRPPVQIWSVQLRPCGTLLGTQVGARWADRTWNPVVLPQSPFPRVALRPQPLDHRGTQAPWHPACSVSCHSGKLGFRQVKRFSAGPAASTFGRRDMPGHLNAGPSPGSPVRGQEAWTRTSESGLFGKPTCRSRTQTKACSLCFFLSIQANYLRYRDGDLTCMDYVALISKSVT